MASLSACSVSIPNYHSLPSYDPSSTLGPLQFQISCTKFQTQLKNSAISCTSSWAKFNKSSFSRPSKVGAMEAAAADQAVSVAVSPADMLTMFFQAEGTMSDSAVPAVTKALEEVEGITGLKVQVLEGIASVELTKQTTVQATGVASNIIETIQNSGFKLQNLNLSFQDEDDYS